MNQADHRADDRHDEAPGGVSTMAHHAVQGDHDRDCAEWNGPEQHLEQTQHSEEVDDRVVVWVVLTSTPERRRHQARLEDGLLTSDVAIARNPALRIVGSTHVIVHERHRPPTTRMVPRRSVDAHPVCELFIGQRFLTATVLRA